LGSLFCQVMSLASVQDIVTVLSFVFLGPVVSMQITRSR
jgi:hypothetical protein